MGLVLIGWVEPKVNGFDPNRLDLGLGSGLSPRKWAWS